jgi:hypothetical protein
MGRTVAKARQQAAKAKRAVEKATVDASSTSEPAPEIISTTSVASGTDSIASSNAGTKRGGREPLPAATTRQSARSRSLSSAAVPRASNTKGPPLARLEGHLPVPTNTKRPVRESAKAVNTLLEEIRLGEIAEENSEDSERDGQTTAVEESQPEEEYADEENDEFEFGSYGLDDDDSDLEPVKLVIAKAKPPVPKKAKKAALPVEDASDDEKGTLLPFKYYFCS